MDAVSIASEPGLECVQGPGLSEFTSLIISILYSFERWNAQLR